MLRNPNTAMTAPLFGHLPRSEIFSRRYYGRNVDLMAIESATLLARVGIMTALTDLQREMLQNDPAVSSFAFKRAANLASCDWDIQPANVGVDNHRARQVADACRLALSRFKGFRQFLYDMAWGVCDGRAASEITWAITSGPIRYWPTGHNWLHPGRLSFGPQRELRVVERYAQTSMFFQVGDNLDAFEPGKIVQWLPRNFGEYPEREGWGPRVLYWQFFKRFSWRHRMTLTELFALPWRIIETDGDSETLPSGDALDDAEEAVENLGAETTAALDPGMRLELKGLPPESAELFKMNAEEINAEIEKLVTLQSSVSSGQMNRASGVIADKQQDIALEWDGTGLAPVITEQLLRPFVALNFGDDDVIYTPTLILRTKPERDRDADIKRAGQVLEMGLPVSESELYERSGYRKPKDGEPVVRQAPGAPAAADGSTGAAKGPIGEEDTSGAGGSAKDAIENLLENFEEDARAQPDDGEKDAMLRRLGRLKSVGLNATPPLLAALRTFDAVTADRYVDDMVGARLLAMTEP